MTEILDPRVGTPIPVALPANAADAVAAAAMFTFWVILLTQVTLPILLSLGGGR